VLEPAPTRTGYRVVYGPDTLPEYNRLEVPLSIPPAVLEKKRADPTHFLQNDGFSPTVQVLMNFEGVDPGIGPALPARTTARGYVMSPSSAAARVNHWIENDSRVQNPRAPSPSAPGRGMPPAGVTSAVRSHRQSGAPVEAEPVRSIRWRPSDTPPSTDAAASSLLRRPRRSASSGADLAFDFVVSSDHSLTHDCSRCGPGLRVAADRSRRVCRLSVWTR
jgi:hypothetical protein